MSNNSRTNSTKINKSKPVTITEKEEYINDKLLFIYDILTRNHYLFRISFKKFTRMIKGNNLVKLRKCRHKLQSIMNMHSCYSVDAIEYLLNDINNRIDELVSGSKYIRKNTNKLFPNNKEELEETLVSASKYIRKNMNKLFPNNKELETLDVRGKKLTMLPEDLAERYPNLKYLDCSNNLLDMLPVLPSTLTTLLMESNSITELNNLPPTIETIMCSDNEIIKIPDVLPQTLIRLCCAANNLHKLPETLPNNLAVLDCSYNRLENINMLPKSLITLNCSNNKLKILPILSERVTNLNCCKNPLELPNNISASTKITITIYRSKYLPQLPDIIYLKEKRDVKNELMNRIFMSFF